MISKDKKYIIAKIIREETGCGLGDATIYFDALIDAINRRPILVMDNIYRIKIDWEQPE